MDSNFESQSPDNADREPSFRKSSNDKANRKYRRHSSVSGSISSSSDGSPKHGRSPSPAFSREDPSRASEVQPRRKSGGRELDMEPGRSRFDKGGDSHRHSDRKSYRSSHDYHRHGDYNRHHKRADEGERSYHRPSGHGRESRSGTRSDRTRQGREHDRWGDYRRNTDKYAQERSDDEERRCKDKDREDRKEQRDKNFTMERTASDRRHTNSYMDDSKSVERDRLNKDSGGRDDMQNYGKSLADSRSSFEEATGRGRHSYKDSSGSYLKESEKGNMKDLSRHKGDTMEKRKHDGRETDRHKEKFCREPDEKDYNTSINRKNYGEDELHKDYPARFSAEKENESSPKKLKMVDVDKEISNSKGRISSASTIAADERPPARSKVSQETINKLNSEPAQSSNEAVASHDFDAAKVAAMKAAELVNRNLVGSGCMSTDQKKKLLWGSKKNTAVEESGHRWDVSLFPDRDRQEKFKKLMGVKGDLKPEQKPENKDTSGLLQAEKQEQLQLDLEKQYTAGLRRRDGRTVGLGL